MKRLFWLGILALLVLLAGAARSWSRPDAFIEGKIYFADPDCYSRMTRVRMVDEGRAWTIRHHDFENFPQGTNPHTTAPLDWLIVATRRVVDFGFRFSDPARSSVLRAQTLDLAGALIGPLLGLLACISAAVALPRSHPGEDPRVLAAVALLAVSPIVMHGTELGRPDHQSLLIALLTLALATEVRLLRSVSRAWAVAGGIAWGLAWWVSLYEPPILFAAALLALAVANRRAFGERERWLGWAALLAVFILGIAIDGWRLTLPDAALRDAFQRWKSTVGELHGLWENWRLALGWLGWFCLLVPVGLVWKCKSRPESRWLLVVFAATAALTVWQLRWGYFLAVVCALALPEALAAPRRRWMAWTAFAFSLWPIASDWDARLYPDESEERRRYVERAEQKALREIADMQRERKAGPFVAPWWLSPAMAYWSGQPGVAGSSHESLPGMLDTARIYLAPDAATALPILRERQAAWILSDDPERVIETSAALLGVEAPAKCLANTLAQHVPAEPRPSGIVPDSGVPRPFGHQFFQVWRVQLDAKPQNVPE